MDKFFDMVGGIAGVAQFGYQIYRDRKEDSTWVVRDLPSDLGTFVRDAIEAGVLRGSADDYVWQREEKGFGLEAAGTHKLTLVENRDKRILFRPVVVSRQTNTVQLLFRRVEPK